MSKKISINIGRIVIGIPSKPPATSGRPGAREILHQIFAGIAKDDTENETEIASIEEIKDSLTKYVGALDEDIVEMGKEEHPEKIKTFVDGYGEVNIVRAKEILSARVADLRPILELVNTAVANEEARQEAADKEAS